MWVVIVYNVLFAQNKAQKNIYELFKAHRNKKKYETGHKKHSGAHKNIYTVQHKVPDSVCI